MTNSPRQYKPFNYRIGKIPIIVYPVKDENSIKKVFSNLQDIKEHLKNLYKINQEVNKGDYHIVFIWNLDNKRMTDVWIYSIENWTNSGPLMDCITFRDLSICEDAGIASGDSIIVLGREEEFRRKNSNLVKYLDRNNNIPNFPKGMKPREIFK